MKPSTKIINIKNILRIIVLILVIFSMIKSCSYAYTWEDYIDFCKNINNSLVTLSDTKWQANRIVQYQQTYLNLIANAGYDINDYNTFLCIKERGSQNNYIIITNKTLNVQFNYNGYQTYVSNLDPFLRININNNTFQYTTGLNIMYGLNPICGLVEGLTNYGSNTEHYLNNQYIYSVLLTTTLRGESPYVFAERKSRNSTIQRKLWMVFSTKRRIYKTRRIYK